jgi:hypothetical protein
MEDMQKL